MANLTTNFIKIAQVGPAFDGRVIREDWLRDMAETYNRETYTAMLWPEHMRWYGNMGEVAELKAESDEKGVFSLFARLVPNKRLLEWNAEGQGLFYSIEVEEDFPGTPGKTYLGGLGVTDSPASLGLVGSRFSTRKDTKPPHCMSNMPFDASALSAASADEHLSWFKTHIVPLFTQNTGENAPDPKDDTMDEMETRVAEFEERLDALESALADLDGRVAALEVDVAASGDGDGAGSDPAYKALAKHIGAMNKRLDAFTSHMSATVKSGTKAPANVGPSKGKSLL